MSSFSGTAPSSNVTGYTPWQKPPGYDFSSALYSYMTGLIGQPAPSYGGFGQMNQTAGRQNPYVGKMGGLAQDYWNMGMPSVFNTGISSLGRFLNPSFQNPTARMQLGAPNYFGNTPIPAGNQPPMNPFLQGMGAVHGQGQPFSALGGAMGGIGGGGAGFNKSAVGRSPGGVPSDGAMLNRTPEFYIPENQMSGQGQLAQPNSGGGGGMSSVVDPRTGSAQQVNYVQQLLRGMGISPG